jgi:dihydrodipicolinate synthase/N-acetylneuraminate lyase
MNSAPITPELLAGSVISVPPLARSADLTINTAENTKIIRHLEAGGVTTLLYGGNAALAHVSLSEYGKLLGFLAETAAPTSTVVPSFGPTYGLAMDQVGVLKEYGFPTVMLLPSREATTPVGIANGVRRLVERLGRPIVLYLKHDGMVDVATTAAMVKDGLISWIKYAIVRPRAADDTFLKELVAAVGPQIVVSGMGEQPAIIHLRDFGLVGFTSGCVCVAPKLSMDLLRAAKQGEFETAERIREQFAPLEALRDGINPVRVLHAAVQLAGIAQTGPITPFWSEISASDEGRISEAARALLALQNRA